MLTRDAYEDRRSLQARLLSLRVGLVACVSMLLVAFWVLQVLHHRDYDELARNNRLRTIPLRAPRGVLFDRDGTELVGSNRSFTIAIVRERSIDLDSAADRLASVVGVEPDTVRAALDEHLGAPAFRPITVVRHATLDQVAAVTARRLELPEVVVQYDPTRRYPAGGMAAHLFGYVSEVRQAQLDTPEFEGVRAGDIVGQTGLERTYNQRLMGTDGARFIVVDSLGREVKELPQQDPIDGQRLQLTIDADLQRALEDGFRAAGFAGAGALLDPSTGEVFAMTSLPAYDPNAFATGISRAELARLNSDPLTPFTNRLIQGRYQPGSTFKIVMALAALSEGVTTPDEQVFCSGKGTFGGREFLCNRTGGHGAMDLRHALQQSCNVFFYTMAERLDIETIRRYSDQLGLTGRTGIDLPGEVESRVQGEAWKREVYDERWYPSETVSVSIGQGPVDVTPLSLAVMMSAIANGGTVVTPHLVRAVDDGQGWQPFTPPSPRASTPIPAEILEPIRDGLWMAVNGTGGTAVRAGIAGRDVVAKTGTAQVISLAGGRAAAGRTDRDLRDNAWFVFFAPRTDPEIAGVIFAEHAEHGSVAAPIARHVLETYFAKREGRSLPTLPPAVTAADAVGGAGRGGVETGGGR
jgi:penicillin-binding protein 2